MSHLNPHHANERFDQAQEAGKIKSAKQLAEFSTELLDSEIQQAVVIIKGLQTKYSRMANSVANLEKLRDEALTRMAEIGVLASFDPTPCFYGDPPVLEFIGKVAGDAIHTEGLDHEQKKHEVVKSKERGEDYLGQKETVNKRKDKK